MNDKSHGASRVLPTRIHAHFFQTMLWMSGSSEGRNSVKVLTREYPETIVRFELTGRKGSSSVEFPLLGCVFV